MAATIKDIAKETGLGLATVSSYINGGNVREKNRIKIEAAIRELHYEVNETARGLKTNRTMMLGAVIPELDSIFCARVLTQIEDTVRRHGYGVMVCDCRSDTRREKEALDFLLRRRVDGLFNIPVDESGKNIEAFIRSGKPVVLVDRKIDSAPCDYVCVDNKEAIAMAVRFLAGNGHRFIAMIAGPDSIQAARDRRSGYRQACLECGICCREDYIYSGDDTMPSGTAGIEKIVREHPEITAVISSNYQMSVGIIAGLNDMGIDIPGGISVIGFDNPEFAKACRPKLTIVNQPVSEIGRKAAEIMLGRLAGENCRPQEKIILRADLLPGSSVAALH